MRDMLVTDCSVHDGVIRTKHRANRKIRVRFRHNFSFVE